MPKPTKSRREQAEDDAINTNNYEEAEFCTCRDPWNREYYGACAYCMPRGLRFGQPDWDSNYAPRFHYESDAPEVTEQPKFLPSSYKPTRVDKTKSWAQILQAPKK
jgi:hypothetical protein